MAEFWSEKCAKENQMEKRVPVNKIIPFSSVDGPGNRSAIFLQGCNFDCYYCHNPETRKLCYNCGKCVSVCPNAALSMEDGQICFEINRCVGCDNCIKTCDFDSSPRIQMMTPTEVFEVVKKQRPFIRGVTVSGGECTLYPQFLQEFFAICQQNGLDTMIDTNGTLDFSQYPQLLEVTNGVMLDIKVWSETEHHRVIGGDNQMVKKNAVYLARQGKLLEVRTVIVPELFDYQQTVLKTAELLVPYLKVQDIRYKLIAYRPQGVRSKYDNYQSPLESEMKQLKTAVKEQGFSDIIII